MTKPRKRTFTHTHRQRLDRVIALYLDDCYAKRTAARVSELAALVERHPDYLTRTAASILGVNLRPYLRRKQLEEAERLIRTIDLPLNQIALHAGFGTPSTFYRCFKQLHGIPPGAFRKVRK